MDFSNFTKNMDLKFNVTLPYKAVSNNANNVSDDGKNIENDINIPSDITGSSSINNVNNIDTKQSSSNKGLIFGAIGAAIAGIFAGIFKKFKDRKNKRNDE